MNRKINKNIENEFFLADWMSGKITDKELKDLVSLEDYIAYKKIDFSLSIVEKPKFDVEQGFENLSSKLKGFDTQKRQTKVKKLIPTWLYAVAASFVLLFGVFQYINTDVVTQTNFGEQNTVVLSDGSSVILNAKSTLTYKNKWSFDRNVFLEGEAFFKITKGDKFDVNTAQGIVSVLGTQFNVIARNGIFEVICYEGKVAVTHNDDRTILLPGKAFRLVGNKITNWETSKESSTWQNGTSNFNSVPLKFVLLALQNEFNVTINSENIDDSVLFTGSFKHSDLESAIESIALLLNVDYKIVESNKIILVKKQNVKNM